MTSTVQPAPSWPEAVPLSNPRLSVLGDSAQEFVNPPPHPPATPQPALCAFCALCALCAFCALCALCAFCALCALC